MDAHGPEIVDNDFKFNREMEYREASLLVGHSVAVSSIPRVQSLVAVSEYGHLRRPAGEGGILQMALPQVLAE